MGTEGTVGRRLCAEAEEVAYYCYVLVSGEFVTELAECAGRARGVDGAVLGDGFGGCSAGCVEVAEFEVGPSGPGEVERAVAHVTGGVVLA